jgi:hypothetical protein
MRIRLRPLHLAFAVVLLDCATLEALPSGTCGNGVIDATEDCDSFPANQCGAPGGAGQCRLSCGKADPSATSAAVLTCPTGWGCGVEGFCREPTGAFEDATERVSVGVTSLLVGDFDGDGRKDLFGTSALGTTAGKGRIHYFGARAALTQTVALPAVITSPFVRDLDGDGRDDLAFGYGFRILTSVTGGFALVLGQADRAIVPKLFPSFTRPEFDGNVLPLAGDVPAGAQPLVAVGKAREKGAPDARDVLLSVDLDLLGRSPFRKELPGDAKDIAGAALAGIVFARDATSACGEIIVPINTAAGPHVQVYSPCIRAQAGGPVVWARERPPVEVQLPPGERTIRGVHLVTSPKGNADLMIAGGSGALYLARSDGATLGAARPLTDYPELRLPELDELPLASADINRDGAVDFVLPRSVLLSVAVPDGGDGGAPGSDAGPATGSALAGYLPVPVPSKRWTVATIADVNRDGALDVIGASSSEPDIDVLQGVGTSGGLFLPSFTITTTGTVKELLATDLDLDGTQDIAFIESRAASDESEVAISYGRALTMPPEPERTAGRARGIRQFFTQPGSIAITTSVPSANAGELATFSLALLFASGERQPFAPLLLDEGQSQHPKLPAGVSRDWVPRAVAAGPIQKADRIDFVALADGTLRAGVGAAARRASAFGIWTAAGAGPAAFDAPKEAIVLTEIETALAAAPIDTSLVVQARLADIDGDGISELVAVTPNGQGSTVLRVFRSATASQQQFIVPDRRLTPNGRSELVDADGDGKIDIVTILVDGKGVLGLNVFYGDGAGGFAVPGDVVALPASEDPRDVNALGFAFFTAEKGRPELAIVTPARLFRARIGGRGAFELVDETARFGLGGLANASDVASGDFDGDGVEDLAVADSGAIRILRQRPRLP